MKPVCYADFTAATHKALGKKGIRVIGSTYVPGASGGYLDGETAYKLDDNGTHKVRRFLDVLAAARA